MTGLIKHEKKEIMIMIAVSDPAIFPYYFIYVGQNIVSKKTFSLK